MACQLYQTIIELVQGPCHANQLFLIGTNLCDIVVRCLHGSYSGCKTAEVIELKLLCLKLLLALLEGVQSDTIPRRIAASLDLLLLVRDMDAAYRNSSEGEGLSEEERPCSVAITPCSVVISACSEGEGLQQRGLTLP